MILLVITKVNHRISRKKVKETFVKFNEVSHQLHITKGLKAKKHLQYVHVWNSMIIIKIMHKMLKNAYRLEIDKHA